MSTNNCTICGEPMREGEYMFKMHGYSGPCPKPPLPKPPTEAEQLRQENEALRSLLHEGVKGFDHILYANRDLPAVRDWQARARAALAAR